MLDHQAFLREALRLAIEGMDRGAGGPFGAVVVRDGEILGRGYNRVLETHDPTAHAEVVAIRQACQMVGHHHLDGCLVYASCEPCPMCLSACYWARVDRIYFGASAVDAAAAGFADDYIRRDLARPVPERQLLLEPMLADEAQAPFDAWRNKVNRQHYGPQP